MEKKPEEAQMMKEKESSEFQQRERNAAEDQMREEMLHPVKEMDEVEKMLQSGKNRLKAQCEEKLRNMEKEQDRSELRLREIQTREAQMIKKKEDVVKEKDEIERGLQVDKDSLVLQLDEKTRHMKKEKKRHQPQLRLSETREAQMKKEMEDLKKKKDEIKRKFQAERHSLVLKLEEQTSIMWKEKKRSDLQQVELKAKERHMQEEIETLVKEREAMFNKLILEKSRSVLQLKDNIRNMEKEKGESHLQQQESEARKEQMRDDMEILLKEIDEMCRTCSVSIDSLKLQFEKETREFEQPEPHQHETEARKAQLRKDVEMLKEIAKMWRTCQISTENLGLQLEKETNGFEKEKVQFELQQQKDKAREVQLRDEMEPLGKLQDKIKILLADKDSLVFQLEMEKERCNE
ncbi:trichohyalin-like isoform X2, partial [Clarias magur]